MSAGHENAAGAAKAGAAPGGRNVGMLALVGTNMLGMLGLGAYLVMGHAPAAAAPPPAEEHGSHGEHAELGPLLEFESLVVNLADEVDSHYLKVTFQLELGSAEDVEHVESRMVLVRDGVVGYLSSLGVADVRGATHMTEVRERLLVIANERAGGERVHALYFTEYLVQ